MNEMLELYDEVFDANGAIKTCGRNACKKLISACQKLDKNTNFGDLQSGYMNVEAIKALHEKISKTT